MRIFARVTVVMLIAGFISVATYFAVPEGRPPRGAATGSMPAAEFDGDMDMAGSPVDDFAEDLGGERHSQHGESSILHGLAETVKNVSLFAVAMLGAIGIRKILRNRKIVSTA